MKNVKKFRLPHHVGDHKIKKAFVRLLLVRLLLVRLLLVCFIFFIYVNLKTNVPLIQVGLVF
jgi:hypothetical protein